MDRHRPACRGELGVRPAVVVAVDRQDPFGGPLWVRVGDRTCALGAPLIRLIRGDVIDDALNEENE